MRRNYSSLVLLVVTVLIGVPVVFAQDPVIVQPGAPGEATKKLPPSTRAVLPPTSPKDAEFMQGMIMHHAQAVEMTDLIEERTTNKEVRLLGVRISQSQLDEMAFMKKWLTVRGQAVEVKLSDGNPQSSHSHGGNTSKVHRMPGMLTPEQMATLKGARGPEFDILFLKGMIQHHNGALIMVKELFENPGTGQDAELFNFASDVDSGQRAEIKTMENLLAKRNVESKP